eukprot:9224367-Heterocapsa_arctica.AAC.1
MTKLNILVRQLSKRCGKSGWNKMCVPSLNYGCCFNADVSPRTRCCGTLISWCTGRAPCKGAQRSTTSIRTAFRATSDSERSGRRPNFVSWKPLRL